MKTMLEKPVNGSRTAKNSSQAQTRKLVSLVGTKGFWRALSSAALASPHTPILRRLRD